MNIVRINLYHLTRDIKKESYKQRKHPEDLFGTKLFDELSKATLPKGSLVCICGSQSARFNVNSEMSVADWERNLTLFVEQLFDYKIKIID